MIKNFSCLSSLNSPCLDTKYDFTRLNELQYGIVQINLDGKIVFVNEKLLQISGYALEELVGKDSFEFLELKDLKVLRKVLDERRNGVSTSYFINLKDKNGFYKKVLIKGAPVLNSNNEVIGSIATIVSSFDGMVIKDYLIDENDTVNTFLNSFNLAYWVYSIEEGRVEYMSPAFAQLFETDIDHLYRLNSIKNYIHPEDYKTVIKGRQGDLINNEFEVQYRIVLPSLKEKWLLDSAKVLRENDGKAKKIIGFVQDITKIKKAEFKLACNEKEKEAILNSIPDSICIIDLNGIIVNSYFKKQNKEILQRKLKFYENKHYSKVLIKEISEIIKDLFAGKENSNIYKEVRVEFGTEYKWFVIKVIAIGEFKSIIYFKDITSIKNNIDKIQKIFNITESNKDLIVITNLNGIIEYVNPEFCKVTGYNKEELINHSMKKVNSGTHNSRYFKKLWDTISNNRVYKGVIINRKKNGDLFAQEQIITPYVDINGVITNFISSGRDVTKDYIDENGKLLLNRKSGYCCTTDDKLGTKSIIKSEELERKKIANVLHENLGQILSYSIMNLECIKHSDLHNVENLKKLDLIKESLGTIINEIRNLSGSLSPIGLSKYGLYSIVKQLVTKYRSINPNINYSFYSNISNLRFKNEIEINLYRIIQEQLNNVNIHSRARNCEIKLDFNKKREIVLEIIDNGFGIKMGEFKKKKLEKLGILTIEERVKSLNAQLKIKTNFGKGFNFKVIVQTKEI